MLMELLSKASTVAMLSFVVSSMLAMGAGLTIPQIAEPLRNARLVVLALLANFVVMPLGALAIGEGALVGRTLWHWAPAARLCGWSAVLAEAAELAKGNRSRPRRCQRNVYAARHRLYDIAGVDFYVAGRRYLQLGNWRMVGAGQLPSFQNCQGWGAAGQYRWRRALLDGTLPTLVRMVSGVGSG